MNGNNEKPASPDVVQDESVQQTEMTSDRVWDALNHLHQEVTAYNVAPAMLVPHLRNRDLIDKVKDKTALLQNASLLNRDVAEYRKRLGDLHVKHKDRTGDSIDADDQIASIQIHEEYMEWATSYEGVVIPTVVSMMESLLEAGAELDTARLTQKPSDIVEASGADGVIDLELDAGSMQEQSHVGV